MQSFTPLYICLEYTRLPRGSDFREYMEDNFLGKDLLKDKMMDDLEIFETEGFQGFTFDGLFDWDRLWGTLKRRREQLLDTEEILRAENVGGRSLSSLHLLPRNVD